jgi:hypothetical protein
VDIRAVDPRDQTWELERPSYRVYFHDANGAQDEYEVLDADVVEVLAWAQTQRADRTFVLYACVPGDAATPTRADGGMSAARRVARSAGLAPDPHQPRQTVGAPAVPGT